MKFQVVVGNIGTVYDGDNSTEADNMYTEYVAASESGIGVAGGEEVNLFAYGDVIKQHSVPMSVGERGVW